MNLPNAIIIGAPKCATTTLFHWLAAHPDVAPCLRKEAQYLVDEGSSIFRQDANFAEHGLDGYRRLFPKSAHVVLEATPGYLYQRTALQVISEQLTSARLVVVVRDPVERLMSVHRYYSHNKAVIDPAIGVGDFVDRLQRGEQIAKGNEFVNDALGHGEYVVHLRRWVEACGLARILVVRSEDLRSAPMATLRTVGDHLGLDRAGFADVELAEHNVSYRVRHHGVHRLVSKVHRLIPQSAARQALIRAYQSANVGKRPVRTDGAESARAVVAAHYQAFNAQLAEEFGVDTSRWGQHAEEPQ